MPTLLISEKNKAAFSIAEALGHVNTINYSKNLRIYHVPSEDLYVLPLRGHIMGYQNTIKYKSWARSDPRGIITDDDSIEKIPLKYANPYVRALKEYGKKCDVCIIGTDADVEGCNIGMMDAFPFVRQVNPGIVVKQLWINDLQKASVRKAYDNLILPKWPWGFAGEARSIIDAIIGFSATREVSLTLKNILKQINVQFVSIGRVQTSLLYLIYLREKEIRFFQPDKYWSLSAQLLIGTHKIIAYHVENPFKEMPVVTRIYDKIKDVKTARLQSNEKNPQAQYPPIPLNTNDALMLLTKTLKISAKVALKTMEDLYLDKLISYPRTDTNKYKKTFQHKPILTQGKTHDQYGSYVQSLFTRGHFLPRNGKVDAGDHTPITPTTIVPLNHSKLSNPLAKKVYDLLTRHYLALFGENAKICKQKIEFDIQQEMFKTHLTLLLKKGYLEIAPFLAQKFDNALVLDKQTYPVLEILKEDKETQPPPRYNDTSLLKLMEKHGIGTKSTRPAIIELLIDRKYVQKQKRRIFLLELGYLLIENLKEVWLPFLDPKFTAFVEDVLEKIKNREIRWEAGIAHIRKVFLKLFDKFRQGKDVFVRQMAKIEQIGNVSRGRDNKILSKSRKGKSPGSKPQSKRKSSKSHDNPKTTTPCIACQKHPMQLVEISKQKRFIACEDRSCKTYLSVPKTGTLKLLKRQCKLCDFNILKVTKYFGKNKSAYYICPKCWNEGLKEKSSKGFCSKCEEYHIVRGSCQKRTESS